MGKDPTSWQGDDSGWVLALLRAPRAGMLVRIMNVLPSIVVLGLAAFTALVLARSRPSPPPKGAERRAAAAALAVATGVQAVHFAEELATGFHERLGPLFGLPGMPLALFVVFNLAWLGIWIASVPALKSRS